MNESVRKADDILAKVFKLIGKLFKFAFYAIIIGINGILFFRLFTMDDPKIMETLMVNDRTAAAYAEAGEDIAITYQKQTALDDEGLFAQSNLRYIDAVDQLQVTARYNNSTLEKAATAFELYEIPDRDEDVFDITLVKVKAVSAEEQAEDDRAALGENIVGVAETTAAAEEEIKLQSRVGERYHPVDVLEAQKTVYNYRRLIFDDVDLSDASACYLQFYYKGAVNYDLAPYSEVLVWMRGSDRVYELTRADRKALDGGAVDYD